MKNGEDNSENHPTDSGGRSSLVPLDEVLIRLDKEYPDRQPLLDYASPFELLVAVALSAQTTDAAVNAVTPQLFALWPSAEALARADMNDLEKVIHSLGFFRQKAKNLVAAAGMIVERFDNHVPRDMEDLLTLPGIGRKSANVIRAHVYGLSGIIVDTHFGRVCRRLGLTAETDPTRVEQEIEAILPREFWSSFSMTANFHGRRYCYARKPDCQACPLEDLCPQVGVPS